MSPFPSDGVVEQSLLQSLLNVDVIPQQMFKVGFYFILFCLTNDYSVHMKSLLLDKLVFLDIEE